MNIEGYNYIPDDEVQIEFEFSEFIEFNERYPDSLLMGLSKLGGLLALFKISLFLRFMHQQQFEKQFMTTKIDEEKQAMINDSQIDTANLINDESRLIYQ